MGCVMKHPKTGIWQILWYETGSDGIRRQRQRSCKGMTKVQAEKELTRILHELGEGTFLEPSQQVLAVYLRDWLDARSDSWTDLTNLRYSRIVENNIIPRLGQIRLDQLEPRHIDQLYRDLKRVDGLSPKTIRCVHGVLHSSLKRAVRIKLIKANPSDNPDLPKPAPKAARAADRAGILRLLSVIEKSQCRLPILVAIATGMRRGEVAGLKWEDFDEARGLLVVRRSIAQVPGPRLIEKQTKTGEARLIPIPPTLIAALIEERDIQRQRPDLPDGDWICRRPDGRQFSPNSITSSFKRIAARAGVDITFHGLRHTQGTEQLNAGVPSAVVSRRLGHSDIAITHRVYYHALPEAQQQAVEVAEQLINPLTRPSIRVVEGE